MASNSNIMSNGKKVKRTSPWFRRCRRPPQSDYDSLVQRAVSFLPELDLALHECRLGPHVRRPKIPRPPNLVRSIRKPDVLQACRDQQSSPSTPLPCHPCPRNLDHFNFGL